MITSQDLAAVLSANKALRIRAAELNRRAGGTQPVFVVLSNETLLKHCVDALAGARCVREIADLEPLKLPVLDPEMVELVASQYPDTIEILPGQPVAVEYRGQGYAPRARVDGAMKDNAWVRLVDAGYRLPSGAIVELVVPVSSWDSFNGTDVPTLKTKLRGYVNEAAWNAWPKPAIALPDPAVEDSVVGSVVEEVYGTCVATGESLKAFGTAAYNSGRWSNDPYFKGLWFRVKAEAEAANATAVAKLAEVRKEAQDKKELATVVVDARALQARMQEEYGVVDGLYSVSRGQSESSKLYDLRQRLYNPAYYNPPDSLTELRQWIKTGEELLTEVDPIVETSKREREEREKDRLEADQLRQRAYDAYYARSGDDVNLSEGLRSRLYERSYNLPEGLTELRQWMTETTTLLAEVESACQAERNRQAAAEQEPGFAEAMQAAYDDRHLALSGIAFARVAVEVAGLSMAARVLQQESTAAYGRARRQEALSRRLPGLRDQPAAAGVLTAHRDADCSPVLAVAAAWAQAQLATAAKPSKPVPKQAEATAPPSNDAMGSLLSRFGGPSRLSDVGKSGKNKGGQK